jgi:ElaB/YqjD/DUF883 family membrane-anchored ribosome-binding protein
VLRDREANFAVTLARTFNFMEIEELRSKEEILRDIEETRKEAKQTLKGTKKAWSGGNAVAHAWRATKEKTADTKDKVVAKTQAVDEAICNNIYRSIGIALCAGAVAGFLIRMRQSRKQC